MRKAFRFAGIFMFSAVTTLAEDLTVRVAAAESPADLTASQKQQLEAVATALRAGNKELARKHWNEFSNKYFTARDKSAHLDTLVYVVLKDGVLPNGPSAPQRSVEIDKVRAKIAGLDKVRSGGTNYVTRLRQLSSLKEPATVRKLEVKYDAAGVASLIESQEAKMSLEALEAEIRKWEEKLNAIGDDAQLANVDLQNMLQKQQQTLQMMSNISRMLYDTALAVIRKIGG